MSKKQILVPALTTLAILAFVGVVLKGASGAKPGDPLYTLDRTTEAVQLSVLKSFHKLSYGRFNLTLANERIQEIKALQAPQKQSTRFVRRVYAQTIDNQKVQEYIALLLADISRNLVEAQDTLLILPTIQREKLSLEIAAKTTEYGNDLLTISGDLSTKNKSELASMTTTVEKLDPSAMDVLVETSETEIETEDEHSTKVSETLQNKLETKLLKLREALRIYTARLDTNRATLAADKITRATELISKIAMSLGTAETQIGQKKFKTTADILDVTADNIDELKDLIKVDGNEDATNSSDSNDDSSGDDANDDSTDDEIEDSPKPTKSATTGTPNPRETEKPEPSETPEPTEAPEEHSQEDQEDVDGIQTQPSSDIDVLRNQLRF